jgi:8-amino-7-oxononanoate synthase
MLPGFITKLLRITSSGTQRKLPNYAGLTDFISNDYLGLAHMSFATEPDSFSGTGSRLISGNSNEAVATERYLAEVFDCEATLVFNSGYDANLGLFSTMPQRGEIVLYDELVHASIRDGLRLGLARSFSFRHNSLTDLEGKLQFHQGKTVFIAIESVYSMDGDHAPLVEILELAMRYNAYVLVDEAHAAGVFGDQGEGIAHAYRNCPNLLARVITFGKAFGAHGAAVLSNRQVIDFLIHSARSFIYTTALPPDSYSRMRQVVQHVRENPELRQKLGKNCEVWNREMNGNPGPIQVIPFPDITTLKTCVEEAERMGWALKGVWSPTVPEGKQRLRICIHAHQDEQQLVDLTNWLKKNYI